MKREYHKPYLAVESFQLNAAVAASCTADNKAAINYGLDDCILGDDLDKGEIPDVIFGSICENDLTNPQQGDPNDTRCYHGPVLDVAGLFIYS